jgi:hypothetical protein
MNHRPASSPPPPAGRSIPRTRRMITACGGLAVFLAAAIGLASAASATPAPPEPSVAPIPPPPPITTAPAHFPLWAVAAMVAATVVLSVATTLITLSLEHMRWARRTSAAAAEPPAGALTSIAAPAPDTGQAEILSSHRHTVGHGQ